MLAPEAEAATAPAEAEVDVLIGSVEHAFATRDVKEVGLVYPTSVGGGGPGPVEQALQFSSEGALGLSLLWLKPLFLRARARMMDMLLAHRRNGEEDPDETMLQELLPLTRAVLLVKGDVQLAWTWRKRAIQMNMLDVFEELKFSRALFTKHPKASVAWHHRKWCYECIPSARLAAFAETLDVVQTELQLCEWIADLYPKNYYAWQHRLWILRKLGTRAHVDADLEFTGKWLRTHVSDHSAAHHRNSLLLLSLAMRANGQGGSNNNNSSNNVTAPHQLVPLLLVREGAKDQAFVWPLLLEALHHCDALIAAAPGHETLWIHRRFVANLTRFLIKHCSGARDSSATSSSTVSQELERITTAFQQSMARGGRTEARPTASDGSDAEKRDNDDEDEDNDAVVERLQTQSKEIHTAVLTALHEGRATSVADSLQQCLAAEVLFAHQCVLDQGVWAYAANRQCAAAHVEHLLAEPPRIAPS